MSAGKAEKYRIVRGGQWGTPRRMRTRTPAEFNLDREMLTAFAALAGADGKVPSEGVYDIRRGRQAPWRILARRFREAHDAGVPKGELKEVVGVLDRWIESLYCDMPRVA